MINDCTPSVSNGDMASPGKLLLSICMAAGNDGYTGNFGYRFETTLNHMARNARDLDALDLMEIVVTDWNSEKKPGDAVHLSPEASKITRFIHVPPDIAAPYNPPGGCFNNTLSINIALRRAQGRFLLYMPPNTLFSRASLQDLLDLLKDASPSLIDSSKTLMLICRKVIPRQFVERKPDIDAIDTYLHLNSWQLHQDVPLPGLHSAAGAILMNRQLFHECRGFDETLIRQGWFESELGLRINQKSPFVYLDYLGVYCYVMDFEPEVRNEDAATRNPNVLNTDYSVNGSNWGLGDEALKICRVPASPYPQRRIPDRRARPGKMELLKDMRDSTVTSLLADHFGGDITRSPGWPAIFLLAYYTQTFKPESFVDFGFASSISLLVSTFLYPCLKYIGINRCSYPCTPEDLYMPIHYCKRHSSYLGHMHIIADNSEASFHNLTTSIDVNQAYDMVYFITFHYPDSYINHLDYIIRYVSDGGAVIIRTPSHVVLNEVALYLANNHPSSLFLKSYRNNVGLFLKSNAETGKACDRIDDSTQEMYLNSIISPRMQ